MEDPVVPPSRPKHSLLIGLLIVVLLVVGVSFFLASSQKKPSPTPSKSDETSNLVPSAMPTDQAVKGQLIVKFNDGITDEQVNALLSKYNAKVIGKVTGINNTIIQVPQGQENAVMRELSQQSIVKYSERNYIQRVQFVPNDTYFKNQWGLINTGQQIQGRTGIANDDIHVKTAWDVTRGAGVKVAVLDTGIDMSHPDLAGKVIAQKAFTTNTIDDKYGHGTHVAGVIAADTNNNLGIAGVCPDCKLLIGKAIGDNGAGDSAIVSNAMIWAVDNGAKVINVSLGGNQFTQTQQDAVNYAWSHGAVIVGAAGNNNSTQKFYPGAMTNVISVAATDNTDAKASFSNFGSWVTVAAPGLNIFSTVPTHAYNLQQEVSSPIGLSYAYLSGTSMATPVVSGAVALLWASPQGTSNSNIVLRLYATADRISGTGASWQKGRINVANAIGVTPSPTVAPSPLPTATNAPTQPPPGPTAVPTGILTPTLYCLGSCPTLPPSPTTAVPTVAQTITPGTSTAPSGSITPETSINPCEIAQSSNVEAAHNRRHHKRFNGLISQFFMQLLELLKQLIGLLGGNGGSLPGSGTTPTPTPTPCPSITETVEPTITSAVTEIPTVTVTESPTATPTAITPVVSPTVEEPTGTTSPSQISEAPSATPEATINPCQTTSSTVEATARHGRHHRPHHGLISQFFQWLLQLLQQLFQLLGGGNLPGTPGVSPTPSPTTTGEPTTTPCPSLSPSPSSAGVSVSPTVPVTTGTNNCILSPHTCGFPDQTNTGVPSGTTLTVQNGNLAINQAGTVIDGKDIRGCVDVNAPNVTIKNSKITCNGAYPIANRYNNWNGSGSPSGLIVQDVEISCQGAEGNAASFSSMHLTRVNVHDCADGFRFGSNVIIEDSYAHGLTDGPNHTFHTDGAQTDGGAHIVLRHNTLINEKSQTSAILLSTNTSAINDVTIDHNLLSGGGYELYCAANNAQPNPLIVTNNRFARNLFPKGGYWGPTAYCNKNAAGFTWTNNVWDDTGATLNP